MSLLQMYNAEDDDEFKRLCAENMETIIDSGYTKAMSAVNLAGWDGLIQCVKKHNCILKTKAELDQLKSGLCILGMGSAMEMYPELMSPLFLKGQAIPLSAGNGINTV